MQRYDGYSKNFRARVARWAAALCTSATLLIALLGAFYSVSSEPVLADLPEARLTVADCEARGERASRHDCVRHLVARAHARDAGASQVAAALDARQRRGDR